MSWWFEFPARNKADALAYLDSAAVSAPEVAKAFVRQALVHLGDDVPVLIKSTGHLCDGLVSSLVSMNNTSVTPLKFVSPTPTE